MNYIKKIEKNLKSSFKNKITVNESTIVNYLINGTVTLGRSLKNTVLTLAFVLAGILLGQQAMALTSPLTDMHNVDADGHIGVVIGPDAEVISGEDSVAIGKEAVSNKTNSVVIGSSAKASVNSDAEGFDVVIGSLARSEAGKSVVIGKDASSAATSAVVLGKSARVEYMKGVALGDDSIVGINEAATDETNETFTLNGIEFEKPGFAGGATMGDGYVVSVGGKNTYKHVYRQITNVAAGEISESSTDAINGSQLAIVGTKLMEKIKGNETAIKDAYHTVANKNTDDQVTADASKTSKIKAGDTITFEAGKNLVSSLDEAGNIKVSTKEEVSFENVAVGPVVINKDTGINAGDKKITNVADGDISATSKDAVNGSQLDKVSKASKEDVKSDDKTVTVVKSQAEDGSNIFDLSVKVDDATMEFVPVDPAKPDEGKKLAIKTATVTRRDPINGDFELVDEADKNKLLTAETVTAMVNSSVSRETVVAGKGITVTHDNVRNNREFKVSLSDDMIKKIDSAGAGAASGMAMTGIPQVTYDRLFGVGAGAAYYGGHGAFAVGVSGQNRARNFVWKVNGSVSTKGTLGVAAGFNVSLGSRLLDKVKDIPVANNKELDKLKERVAKLEADKSIKFIVDNFVLDKDKITARQLEKLKYVVETINTNYPNSVIEIHGFTDIQYKDKYNMDLGLRRARNGKAILRKLGLKNENIIVLSKGYNEMLDGSYGENRRIEILVNHFDEYVK